MVASPASQKVRILHLEDSPEDAEIIHRRMRRDGLDSEITVAIITE